MLKITNDGLTRSGWLALYPYGNTGRQRVKMEITHSDYEETSNYGLTTVSYH